jgi:hypothetical protein
MKINPGSTQTTQNYNVYGYSFQVNGDCPFAVDGIKEDFTFFASESGANPTQLDLFQREPDYDALPVSDAQIYTPRNVVYRDGDSRILDFGGRGLGRYDARSRRFQMESADDNLVYEAAYLFLLSQIGQTLDARGMHRLHALAMSYHGRSILVLLPMGGGKSTLGAALLKHPGIEILSDDSPFIDRAGRAHAFPLRLGLLSGREHEVPAEHRRLINRMGFGEKYLVNYSYFANRVTASAQPGLVILGRRTLARQGRLTPASYRQTMSAMVPNMIVGLGLFQGLEYLLERSSREIAGNVGLALSRSRNAHALTRKSRNYVFHMGRDSEANAQAILDLAARSLK